MTEILYYPLIDRNSDGTEKVAMIPTPNSNTVAPRSSMWLEEMIPHYFRLHAKSNCPTNSAFAIRCPLCGNALKRISEDINETIRGLYVCSSCVKK